VIAVDMRRSGGTTILARPISLAWSAENLQKGMGRSDFGEHVVWNFISTNSIKQQKYIHQCGYFFAMILGEVYSPFAK
jgi:hypothetical protein